jgi:hypothetical protein
MKVKVYFGVAREVPASAVRFAQNLLDVLGTTNMVPAIRAIRARFDLDLAAARGCFRAAAQTNPLRSDGFIEEHSTPMHGGPWWYCSDSGACEDHWDFKPREQFEAAERDFW